MLWRAGRALRGGESKEDLVQPYRDATLAPASRAWY